MGNSPAGRYKLIIPSTGETNMLPGSRGGGEGVVDEGGVIGLQPVINIARTIRAIRMPRSFNMGFPFHTSSLVSGSLVVELYNNQRLQGLYREALGYEEQRLSNSAWRNQ
jgi:hypothetical protein